MILVRTLTAALALGLAGCTVAATTQPTGEWRVANIGGADVIDGSTVTLDFFEAGGLGGSGGCNRYTTSLGEDGFPADPVVSTMMACAEPLMDQERRFFAALETVTRHETGETGRLLLFAGDAAEPVIVARRSAGP